MLREPLTSKQVIRLTDANDIHTGLAHLGEGGRTQRLSGIVLAVGCSHEIPGRPGERARNNTADQVLTLQNLSPADLAHLIQLGQRDDVVVRGDLEHRVSRRVHNRIAGTHMFFAQFGDDRGPRLRSVAQGLGVEALFEGVDDLERKSVGVRGERLCQCKSHHLPVTAYRILPLDFLLHDPKRTYAIVKVQVEQILQAKSLEMREAKSRHTLIDMAKRVRTSIPVHKCILGFPDADAVQNNDDGSLLHGLSVPSFALVSLSACRRRLRRRAGPSTNSPRAVMPPAPILT